MHVFNVIFILYFSACEKSTVTTNLNPASYQLSVVHTTGSSSFKGRSVIVRDESGASVRSRGESMMAKTVCRSLTSLASLERKKWSMRQ